MAGDIILETRDLSKEFKGFVAVSQVNLKVMRGTIHALIGPNGPRNFHDADFRAFASGFSLFSAISRGKGHMPGWDKTLRNQEIADVSEYVLRTFVMRRRTAADAK